MKKLWKVFIGGILVVLVVVIFMLTRSGGQGGQEGLQSTKSGARHYSNKNVILERVKKAARSRFPNIIFEGKEETLISNLGMDELDTMELLLAIEDEFGRDIPQEQINAKIGRKNRDKMSKNLTLILLAEMLGEKKVKEHY